MRWPTAKPISCPEADGFVYDAEGGSEFAIQCPTIQRISLALRERELLKVEKRQTPQYYTTMNECIDPCKNDMGCFVAEFNPADDSCYLSNSSNDVLNTNTELWRANLIRRGLANGA